MASNLDGKVKLSQTSRGAVTARWLVVAFCLLWVSGCVAGILGRNVTQNEKNKPDATAKLIKPRVAAGEQSIPASKESRWEKPGEEGKQGQTGKEKPSLPADNYVRPVSGADDRRAESKDAKPSKGTSPQRAEKSGDRSARGKSIEERLESQSEPRDYREDDKESFKKHNHAQYVETIEKKAQQMVKDHRDASLARMCKDSTTDQWTLNIYRRDPKVFSFISYSWDEVDEKWEKSFESRRQPISRWHSHLDFSAARKSCKVLKGGSDR